MILIFGSCAIIFSIALLFFAVWPRNKKLVTRPRSELSDFRKKELSTSSVDRIIAPFMDRLYSNSKRLTPGGMVNDSTKKLVIAGLSSQIPLEALLGVKLLLVPLLGSIVILLSPFDTFIFNVFGCFFAGAIGFFIPDAYINRKAQDRQAEIKSALPSILDQLTVTVEAGLGFDSAIKRVVSSSSGPLVDEFARTLRAMRLGLKRSEALQQIAERTDVPEVKQFVSAIKQADKLGVPIAKVLRIQSNHMRELKRLAAEEAAMRLPVKLTFPMVFCMLPALFLLLLGPVAIRLIDNGGLG